jgi:hypothetical protein
VAEKLPSCPAVRQHAERAVYQQTGTMQSHACARDFILTMHKAMSPVMCKHSSLYLGMLQMSLVMCKRGSGYLCLRLVMLYF